MPCSAMIKCGPVEALKGALTKVLAATDEKLMALISYVSIRP